MSYISARVNKKTEKIDVIERVKGKRIYASYPINYDFYIDDPHGQYRSIYNTPLTKVEPKTTSEFHRELNTVSNKRVWESDLNLVFKCLSQQYRHQNPPELHVAFLDIEVDFNNDKGYAPIDDPFNAITAITLYHQWTQELITLALRPRTLTIEKASEIATKFENTMVFNNELDLITAALDLLEDVDVLTGWNSEGFDIPYLVNRIARIMSKDDTRRLCLWGEKPKEKEVEKYGNSYKTYELVGRVHLDLMDVYRKFTYEERHSYSLNAIAEYELTQSKTPYAGSLDKLYNEDFEKFLEYNRQDVTLLHLLEDKLKLIPLINEIAHSTSTLLPNCLGTVAVFDQAVINRAHDLGLVVPNKDKNYGEASEEGIAGAYVAQPKSGIHEWVGVIDINGLYPSSLRALNMGVETIVGQLRPIMTDQFVAEKIAKGYTFAQAWEGVFGTLEYQAVMDRRPGVDLIIDWETSGKSDTLTAEQCYELIFNSGQPWMISGNGTIFTYERDALVPSVFEEWYRVRQEFQQKLRETTDPALRKYYDRRQMVQKILQNSGYGALTNPASRFNDKRVGQSITLTGKLICRHMNASVNKCITGKYEIEGDAILAADTDSSQFSAWPMMKPLVEAKAAEWNKEIAVDLYTAIGEKVNDSFTEFMRQKFNCPEKFGKLIRGSCETVGSKALYITKKRYAILNYWKDGQYLKEPKLKAMGLDLRRSDTPVICQKFLKTILMSLLTDGTEQIIIKMINDFKKTFKELPLPEQGTPKRVNKITNYAELISKGKGNRVPGHVRAAINWNTLREINHDKVHTRIVDGMKCVVCPLKDNIMNINTIFLNFF